MSKPQKTPTAPQLAASLERGSLGSQVAFLSPAEALADWVHGIVLRRPSQGAAPLPEEQGFAGNPYGALSIVHAGGLIDPDLGTPLAPLEFAGPRLQAVRRRYSGVPVVTTVLLKPGVLHAWLDQPAPTLLNARLDARAWLSPADQDLLLGLHQLSSPAQQVFTLETWLLRTLRPLGRLKGAQLQPAADWSVGEWAQEQRCSPRQLHRRSLNHFGMAPKDLLRLHRLQRGMRMLAPHPSRAPVAPLASAMGYADAAHMAREMRNLTGLSPTQLREALQLSPSAVPWTYDADTDLSA